MKPKKITRKLELNKKTIADLNIGELINAHGGRPGITVAYEETAAIITPQYTCYSCPNCPVDSACPAETCNIC